MTSPYRLAALPLVFCLLGSGEAPALSAGPQAAAPAMLPQPVEASPPPGTPVAGEAAIIQAIYARAGTRFLWIEQGAPSTRAIELIEILNAADTLGLRPGDYAANLLAAAVDEFRTQPQAADPLRFDRLLTAAAVRLVSHLHYGRIDPRIAGFELAGSRKDLDVAGVVAALAVADNVHEVIAATEPRFYHYSLLKTALARYRKLAEDPSLTQLPALTKRTLRPGDAYAGAPALRRLLIAESDLAGETGGAASVDDSLDPALVQALQHFQERHGLTADGVLSAATFAALTTPLTLRVRQIELTLERWRWLPEFDSPPIIVNIPEFRLFAFNTTADRVASILQMPVIVGQAYPTKRTPIFVGDMKYVIFRPYWDVPRSITVREMLPQIRAHADYLERNHFEIVDGEGDDAKVVKPTPEAIAALAAGRLRMRQRPGDDNALGLVKFMFPNAHNVYLHSTPAHRLFAASRRAFSHGCIRVSDPVALAAYVLRNADSDWDTARIEAAMQADKSSRVDLRRPIHVMVLYGTAMATEAGPVQFFDDVYGHDRKLEALLGLRPASMGGGIR